MYPSQNNVATNHKRNKQILALHYPTAVISQKDSKALYRVVFESRKITLWASYRTIIAIQTDAELFCDSTKYSRTTSKHMGVVRQEACFGAVRRTSIYLERGDFVQTLVNLSLESNYDHAN